MFAISEYTQGLLGTHCMNGPKVAPKDPGPVGDKNTKEKNYIDVKTTYLTKECLIHKIVHGLKENKSPVASHTQSPANVPTKRTQTSRKKVQISPIIPQFSLQKFELTYNVRNLPAPLVYSITFHFFLFHSHSFLPPLDFTTSQPQVGTSLWVHPLLPTPLRPFIAPLQYSIPLLHILPKPNDNFCMCINCKGINKLTKKSYPKLCVNDLLEGPTCL